MPMCRFSPVLIALVITTAISPCALSAQTAPPPVDTSMPAASTANDGPAYLNPATWNTVTPTATPNVVYATVPRIPNPSAAASPNPGTPNGIRTPVPNTGPAGTMDLHLDVYT